MTMTNAEWMIKHGYKFSDLELEDRGNEFKIYLKENCVGKYPQGFTMLEAAMKWLDMEHKKPILDDVERRYLSAVIRPFRNKVNAIRRVNNGFVSEYIIIDLESESVYLPDFPAGTMYEGMELGHGYTLEELGL